MSGPHSCHRDGMRWSGFSFGSSIAGTITCGLTDDASPWLWLWPAVSFVLGCLFLVLAHCPTTPTGATHNNTNDGDATQFDSPDTDIEL